MDSGHVGFYYPWHLDISKDVAKQPEFVFYTHDLHNFRIAAK